jgi:hypothetical protein
VAAGYDAAVDMLTRTSVREDMAPDASVFPAARDPQTGGRQLEELAFEIVSTERLGHAAKKARSLSSRGVRRIFAVDVERRRGLEWSTKTDTWEILSRDAVIEDRTLAAPLPLRALVERVKADDAIAAALLAKKNPVIESALEGSAARGEARGARRRSRRGARQGTRQGGRRASSKGRSIPCWRSSLSAAPRGAEGREADPGHHERGHARRLAAPRCHGGEHRRRPEEEVDARPARRGEPVENVFARGFVFGYTLVG